MNICPNACLLYMCVYFIYMNICLNACLHAMPMEARKGHQIPCYDTTWVLGITPETSEEQPLL